jgi:hypothetical protein
MHSETGHEQLSALFLECWRQDPSERPDMHFFFSELTTCRQPNDKSPSSPVPSKKKHVKVARKRVHTGTSGRVRPHMYPSIAAQESWRQQRLTRGHIDSTTANAKETVVPKGEDSDAYSLMAHYDFIPHNDAIVPGPYQDLYQSSRLWEYINTPWQSQSSGLTSLDMSNPSYTRE